MSISGINGTGGASALGGANAAQQLNDRFLKLLVAQMNNQDPLNPLDNAQVTSQMAQINTVTGINNLSDTVSRLLEQFTRVEVMQAAQLTGRDVLVEGGRLTLAAGSEAVGAGVLLDSEANNVRVEIRDANGLLVREMDLGNLDAGIHRFSWDGRTTGGGQAAAGNYTMTIKGTVGGRETDLTELAQRRVEGVRQDGSTVQLVLTGVGPVPYADIKQIL
jgi:flagellar basal-body rod modification protein FlgD